jgi:hypothetical protein
MAFKFGNVGAAMGRGLREYLIELDVKRRTEMLDNLELEGRQRRVAAEQEAAARQQIVQQQQDADRLARIHGPGADLDPNVAGALRAGGYGVQDRTTLDARSLPMTTGPVGADAPVKPGAAMPSTQYSRRNETFLEQQERQQREQEQAEKAEQRNFRDAQADAARTFQAEQGEANRQARAEQSAADRDLKLMIAQMSSSNNMETRALGAELKRLQIQSERDKQDAARTEREQATKARKQGRADVRGLAQGLIDDPNLERISGYFDAQTPDVLPGSIDARKRLEQLVNKLSLQGREALKGSGAISDFEARMLAAAVSAIDPRAGATTVRKHLKAIADVFNDGPTGAGGGGRDLGADW